MSDIDADVATRTDARAKIAITCIALGILIARLVDKNIFDRVDVIGVGLLVLAILPWASSFASEIKVAGVLETKLKEVQAQANEATKRAIAAEDLALRPSAPKVATGTVDGLERLAADYVATRASMPSGDARTSLMTSIFRDMCNAATALGRGWGHVGEWLVGSDPGRSLAAISYFYVFQDQADLTALIKCIKQSRQPFVQYWGLRVVLEVVKANGIARTSPSDVEELARLQLSLAKGTDRAYLIAAINDTLRKQAS